MHLNLAQIKGFTISQTSIFFYLGTQSVQYTTITINFRIIIIDMLHYIILVQYMLQHICINSVS